MASNQITVKMLQRSDTNENWESTNPVLGVGEIGYSTTDSKFKIGDGNKSWNELDYSNKSKVETYFEVEPNEDESDTEAIARVTADETVEIDDMCIVKKAIAGGAYSRAAYVYSGEDNGWIALEGSYSYEDIIFSDNITATVPFGKYTVPSSGSYEIEAKGKSLKQVLVAALADEKFGNVTQPSCSVSLPQAKAYEAGTSVTPTYAVSFNAGKYPYDTSTGVTVESYTVSDTDGNTATTQSGSFPAITVGDSTNYKISATVKHTAGSIPHTNIGNEKAESAIAEGSKSAASGAITSYRSWFVGVVDDTSNIDSAKIRALKNQGAYNGSKTVSIKASEFDGTPKGIIVAYPANSSRGGLSKVLLASTLNADITKNYVQQANVSVEGVNNYDSIEYRCWLYAPALMDKTEEHTITLA